MGGKEEGSQAMAAIHSASAAGEWVLLEGIHLCGSFLSHLSRVMEDIVEAGEEVTRKKDAKQMKEELERLHLSPKASDVDSSNKSFDLSNVTDQVKDQDDETKKINKRKGRRGRRRSTAGGTTLSSADAMQAVFQSELAKDVYRVRGPIHKDFRLWCVTRPVERHFPVSMLQESVCVVIEAVTGLRSNSLQSLATLPLSQRDFWSVEKEEHGKNEKKGRVKSEVLIDS